MAVVMMVVVVVVVVGGGGGGGGGRRGGGPGAWREGAWSMGEMRHSSPFPAGHLGVSTMIDME